MSISRLIALNDDHWSTKKILARAALVYKTSSSRLKMSEETICPSDTVQFTLKKTAASTSTLRSILTV